jgi:hypothetical protein
MLMKKWLLTHFMKDSCLRMLLALSNIKILVKAV